LLSVKGVQTQRAGQIIEKMTRAIDTCLASERGRWILADHEDAHCEYEITAMLEGDLPVSMKLDRTFTEDGTRWIIDYKTSSHAGGDLESFLKSEANRYRGQLRRYREALALTDPRPIKTALYFPLLDCFREVSTQA
jgi:ATP-dependent helicase/nuclease subunit A